MKFAVILVVITVQTQVCFSFSPMSLGGQGIFKSLGWKGSNNTNAPAQHPPLLLPVINTTFSLLKKVTPSDTRYNLNNFAYETLKKSSQKHHNGREHVTDDPIPNKDNDNFPIGMLLLTIVVFAAVFGRIGWLIFLKLKRCCFTAGENSLTRLIIDDNIIYVEGSGNGFASRSEDEEASVVHLGDSCELIILPSRNLVCLITRDIGATGNGNRPLITPLRVSPAELANIIAATDEDEIWNILQPQIGRAFSHNQAARPELFVSSSFQRSPPPSYKNACRVRLESPPPPYESAVEIMEMMDEISENEDETDSIAACTSECEIPYEQQGQDENNTEH